MPNLTWVSIEDTLKEIIELMNFTLTTRNLKIVLEESQNFQPEYARFDKRRFQ